MVVTRQGSVIFGASSDLTKVTYDETTQRTKTENLKLNAPDFAVSNRLDTFLGSDVMEIAEDGNSDALAIGGRSGADVCHGATCVHYGKEKLGLGDQYVQSLVFDQDGTLWVGLESGLAHISRDGKVGISARDNINVIALVEVDTTIIVVFHAEDKKKT